MSRWRHVTHEGQRLDDIGVLDDGTLHNPNGYPDDLVRAAIAGAEMRRSEKRRKAAAKAAVTRKRRHDSRVYAAADRIVNGRTFGPSGRCAICHKPVDDPASVERGVGSDCWQLILSAIEARYHRRALA